MNSYIPYLRLYRPDKEQNLHTLFYVTFSKITLRFEFHLQAKYTPVVISDF